MEENSKSSNKSMHKTLGSVPSIVRKQKTKNFLSET
jgi:hypothetical protein